MTRRARGRVPAVGALTVERPLRGGSFRALRHREYAVFWCASLISNTGTWMQLITVPYVLDQRSGSPALVGVGVFLGFFPTAVLSPLSGSLADRYPRRTVMLWAQGAAAVAALAIWLLWIAGAASTGLLLILVAIGASAQGLTMAAWQAFITQLVPSEEMLDAVRLNQAQFVASRALGPTLAGLVLASLGPGPAFLINGVSYVVVVLALLTIQSYPAVAPKIERSVLAHFSESVRYVRANATLGLAVTGGIVFMCFGNSVLQLIEPFSRHVLDVGPTAYGLLFGSSGFGSLAVIPILLLRPARRSRLLVFGFAAYGAAQIGLGASPGYATAILAVFVMGMANVPIQMAIQTGLQHHVDEEYRGRVMSMYVTTAFGGVPVGALIGGIVAEAVGLRATIIGAAVAMLVLAAAVTRHYGSVRRLDDEPVSIPARGPAR